MDEGFNLKYNETSYFDTVNKRIRLTDQTELLLQIFDTAGLDRYDSLSANYFKGASGFIVVFDYTIKQTFENIKKWLNELKKKSTVQEPTIVVLGNKKDL